MFSKGSFSSSRGLSYDRSIAFPKRAPHRVRPNLSSSIPSFFSPYNRKVILQQRLMWAEHTDSDTGQECDWCCETEMITAITIAEPCLRLAQWSEEAKRGFSPIPFNSTNFHNYQWNLQLWKFTNILKTTAVTSVGNV